MKKLSKSFIIPLLLGGMLMTSCGNTTNPNTSGKNDSIESSIVIEGTVDAVKEAIEDIGEVDKNSGKLIDAISDAFASLKIEEKKQVTNYQKLFDAQKKYAMRNGIVYGDFDEENIVRRIGCLSDIHNSSNIPNALRILMNMDMDTLVISGDITDGVRYYNTESYEIDAVKDKLLNNLPDNFPIVLTLGNHDTSNASHTALFYDKLGPKIYGLFDDQDLVREKGLGHTKIGDYHFITLECDYTTVANEGLTKDAEVYLANKMKEITESPDYHNEYIFVVTHLIPAGTLRDSSNSTAINEILKFYPQAIVVAGHTHDTALNELNINQNRFTTFNPGGLQYTTYDGKYLNTNGYGLYYGDGFNSYDLPSGTLVEIDNQGNLRINRLDLRLDGFLMRDPWIVGAPKNNNSHLCSYPKERGESPYNEAPYFNDPEDVNPYTSIQAASQLFNATVTIDAACDDNDYIHHYKVKVATAGGTPILEGNYLTEYFIYADTNLMPDRFTFKFEGLTKSPAYIEITPYDSFFVPGEKITIQFN